VKAIDRDYGRARHSWALIELPDLMAANPRTLFHKTAESREEFSWDAIVEPVE
jgi:hypothetical protein